MSEFKGTKGLNYERLTQVLSYNELTGVFIWKETLGRRIKKGMLAGWFDKSTGYLNIKIDGKKYKSHRLAYFYVNKSMPDTIDHINHIKTDNRIINLRSVTHKDNCKNKSLNKNNTTGFCGVYFHSTNKKYIASIKVDGKIKHLGSFNTENEALIVRKKAEFEYNYHLNHGNQNN